MSNVIFTRAHCKDVCVINGDLGDGSTVPLLRQEGTEQLASQRTDTTLQSSVKFF